MTFPEYIQGYRLLCMMTEIGNISHFSQTLFSFFFFYIIEIVKEPLANKREAAHIQKCKEIPTTGIFCQVYRKESKTVKPKDLIRGK